MRGLPAVGLMRRGRVPTLVRLPSWSWAYVLFRFGDGVSHALVPLIPILIYDLPLWTVPATAAAMNLVTVPASFLWGGLMERRKGEGRRRLAMFGFATSGLAMAAMAAPIPFALFLVAAAAYTAFGVATAPAASVLLLESVPGKQWGTVTGKMARRTGGAYLAGVLVAVVAGLTSVLAPWWVFLLAAASTFAAAAVARATVEPHAGRSIPRHPAGFGLEAVRNAQRRFERPVWFPGRLRHRPTLQGVTLANGGPLVFLTALFLLFTGSTIFFSSYPGVLVDSLGLSVGLVLLAQAPSNFATPAVYPWAGAFGSKRGEMRASLLGASMRIALIPAMALLILFWTPWSYAPLLLLHAGVGVSFALLQVNGSCLMAKCHRAGRGQGVGNFHAALGLASLTGSLLAAALFGLAGAAAAYLATTFLLVAGLILLASVRHSRDLEPRNAGAN